MPSGHDEDLVARLRAGSGSFRAEADDPVGVAAALVASAGAELVDVADLIAAEPSGPVVADRPRSNGPRPAGGEGDELAVLARRVCEAEEVVAGAVAFEQARAARLAEARSVAAASTAADDEAAAGARADHQAVRFALVVLVLAQLGGIAVFVAAGDLLAVVVPAVALVGLASVVAFHQRPAPTSPPAPSPAREHEPEPGTDVTASPAVRAAQAHLRRQQAAWKVAWWDRQQPVPDPTGWGIGGVRTVVCVDRDGALDERAYATMTAGLPAVIRVVVLVPRGT